MGAFAGFLAEGCTLQQAWKSFVNETGSNHQDEKRMGQEAVEAREETLTITAISTACEQLGRPQKPGWQGEDYNSTPHGSKGSAHTAPPAYRGGMPAPLRVLQSHLPPRCGFKQLTVSSTVTEPWPTRVDGLS